MLIWLEDPEDEKKPVCDGTVAALIRCYQTDKNSPYKGLRQNTARVYADRCRTLERAIGKRRVNHLSGQDLRDCFSAPVCCRDNRKGGRYVVKLCKR